jgi:outer membrane biosynthesis protein TonB
MNSNRRVLIAMFVVSIVTHLLLGAVWSAHHLYTIQNMVDADTRIFTIVRSDTSTPIIEPLAVSVPTKETLSTASNNLLRKSTTSDSANQAAKPTQAPAPSNINSSELNANTPMGPFQSKIDLKKAWINVAESVNYDLLRGISMDISQGEFRLPDELDIRVRAKGDLTIEYPLIAAAMGKEAVVYALLLIDEHGQKIRVQIVRGDPDFDNPVLQSLEKVEFRPAMLKHVPVRSLLLLEFEFRRNPPEIGSP